jgi:(p)ppGpp synthase/HD superfamily hydrolase
MSLVREAMLFATAAHGAIGQRRKYTGADYIVHPAAVVGIVQSVRHSDEMLAAAWLHDVVEDTQVTLHTINDFFGEQVRELVFWLTDISKPRDGNRVVRKTIDRVHLSKAPPPAQTIKLADLIDNTQSITHNDPDFAVVYLREKRALLEVMTKGDPALMIRAMEAMDEAQERLAL